tara:strand:- start:756 stop:1022 length:267 start_codon:yes stop_codon:yes gene_type:complete
MKKDHSVDEAMEGIKEEMRDVSNGKSEDLGLKMEILRRKLQNVKKDDSPEAIKLMKEHRDLKRKMRIRRLKKELHEVESGEDDDLMLY